MGLQIASLLANLYASGLDDKASRLCRFYLRFVDDMFAVVEDEFALVFEMLEVGDPEKKRKQWMRCQQWHQLVSTTFT